MSRVGAEAAAEVHAVVSAAFAARPVLDPPADALSETPESIARALSRHGGLLATVAGKPAGALLFAPSDGVVFLRRFGVAPEAQGAGVAGALVGAALEEAAKGGFSGVVVLAREELPDTIAFWRRHGFAEIRRHAPYVELARWLPRAYPAPDADTMRGLGSQLAGILRAGDLVTLTGQLGAGKTTFTQGLGAGLGVRGDVTSPTFVIARVHPSLADGPALVHVDAYRLGGIDELDDLDLDTSLDEAVTVVEWGEGVAEGLSEDRLEVRIVRATGSDAVDEDPRQVVVLPVGPRWRGVTLI
ncbi:tRNA (adenosine(37)-N6)-threonylcarbamoyltransferase complex ATPase subunit type 1 TsaE [Nocardioides speluncae]|uniref:tRNA (adenosine(37)-N6)-threonylcarbamoyltransferase complex ATPase subunit type 1 TsaE n=1 Tax=Nocardioides speluncae TaxID=2670337 RepID=UPI001F0C1028|nr:tRNA (adenosine(37)-N6)-threonylcarbamoyltransferase complex ATPase subunit type 1 TsaE [Nocardioides speluncae]